jgi:hypothetical protein
MLVAAVVITVVVMMIALIVWAARAPQPDRSGTVVKKYVDPEQTQLTPGDHRQNRHPRTHNLGT